MLRAGTHAGFGGDRHGVRGTPAGSLPDRDSEHCPVINVSDRARTRVLSRVHVLRYATYNQRGHETGSARGCFSFVPDHARRVGLVGAAVTDHPKIKEIVA